jgi:DHA2 family multidrug resistance protein
MDGQPTQPRLGGRAARKRRNPWLIAFTVTLATFMEVLDTSIANVALPHIAGNLSAGLDESTWILTSYLVSNAIVLPLAGWASLMIGRKRYYMLCVTIFVASSFLCGLAPNLGMLVAFRILQGIGGGGLQPSEQAILADTFPAEKRGLAFAFYGFAVVAAPAIGPTLGGWITDHFSWRWIFYINIPVGVVSLLMTHWFIEDPPEFEQERERRRRKSGGFSVDYVGLSLIALGLGFLQYVLDKGNRNDWFGSTAVTVSAVVAGVALVAAVVWELSVKDPIVDLRLLKNRNFAFANVLMLILGFVLLGSTAIIPQFTQDLLDYTATFAGLVISPGGLMVMALMPLVGFLQGRVDLRWLIVSGLIIGFLGLRQMTHFTLDVDFFHVMMARVVQAAGIAFLFVPISTLAYANLPGGQNTSASGLINLSRNIGGSIGIAVSTTFLSRWAQSHQTYLASHTAATDTPFRHLRDALTARFLGQGHAPADAARRALAAIYGELSRQAAMLAYIDVFSLMSWFFLLSIPVCFLLQKPKKAAAAMH